MSQKVAVITGASSGFGLVSSIEMARAGFRVVASMRNLAKRAALDEAAARAGVASSIDVRQLDVTAFETHAAFMDAIARDLGSVDVLVNNAGFSMAGFAEDVSLEELRSQLETNFFGAVSMTKAALPHMRRQGAGHVIMLSSIAGRCANPGLSSYSASKFALEGWSESLRLEMNPLGIRVVLVEPGAFETDIWEKNVKVGRRAFDSDSPNHERSLKFRNHVRKGIKKRDPREVAELIVRIAKDPYPRLRYMIGPDAEAHKWAQRVIPWKRFERLVQKRLGM
jgi:NAD(P)-dependent dehydrogenase (short-subunit alcohol dehydrogenase family)